ncbi:MAG: hypothetical protein MZW92_45215 [Comamonadaceae bacterium]|nr:hypothetical protein [Comamonadaceae bacterium]
MNIKKTNSPSTKSDRGRPQKPVKKEKVTRQSQKGGQTGLQDGNPDQNIQVLMRKTSFRPEQLISETRKYRHDDQGLLERLEFEQLISSLSARFVNISSEKVDAEIERSLKRIYEFFSCDRCALLEGMPDEHLWEITHIAAAENAPPVPVGTKLPAAITPWVFEKLAKNEIMAFSNLDDLPAEANVDKQTMLEWGIRSNLSIPIILNESTTHIIVINSIKNECAWPKELISRVQLLGELFVNALERKKSRLQLEGQMKFETLVAEISTRFVNLPVDQIDSEIEEAQRRVCEFLGVDLSVLWQWSDEIPRILTLTHLYRPLGGPPPPNPCMPMNTSPGARSSWRQPRSLLFHPWMISLQKQPVTRRSGAISASRPP